MSFMKLVPGAKNAGDCWTREQIEELLLSFIVIHTVKGFGIVNKAEIDVFLELSSFFHYPAINWEILKEMGIPDHLTCLLRNLYAGQETTVRTGHGTTD